MADPIQVQTQVNETVQVFKSRPGHRPRCQVGIRDRGCLQLTGIPGFAIRVLEADDKDTHSMSPLKENENNSITTNDGIPSVR